MNKEQTKEYLDWLEELKSYATGEEKWDTSKSWVCESHPLMKDKSSESFLSCKCGAPSMPPLKNLEVKR